MLSPNTLSSEPQARTAKRYKPTRFFLREGSSLIFAVSLIYIFWGHYRVEPETPDIAMWYVFAASFGIIFYIFLQAVAAVTQTLRRETRALFDILVSMIPLMVLGYTAIDWIRSGTSPLTFQLIVMLLATAATLLDVIIFSWFAMRISKLAQEIVEVD
jgi:hypothetical protein